MAETRIIPALADLTQDIAGPVPVQLLQDWASGQQDVAAAQALLDPFRIEGTVVASDTAGLSKLTESKELVEVISLISRPKEIVHALGVEIGGRAIGVWIADNTEMYYPAKVAIPDVVDAMWEAQRRIAQTNTVRIGMCVHTGSFYEIGGGLYGPDADAVENLAEEYSRGDEIIVTDQIRAKLPAAAFDFAPRPDLDEIFPAGVHSVMRANGRSQLRGDQRNYPHPYTDDFIHMLHRLDEAVDKQSAIHDIYGRFLRASAILFLARDKGEGSRNMGTMLDGLLSNALLETIVREAKPGSHLAEIGGGLAVLLFTDVGDALDFATDLRQRFEQNALPVKMGIDYGAILFFERQEGRHNLVGEAVNTASKISEDTGRPGRIAITARAAEVLPGTLLNAEPFETVISKVTIRGFVL